MRVIEFKKFSYIWVYFNFVDFIFFVGGGGMYVHLIPVCTWLTYNDYDYSA